MPATQTIQQDFLTPKPAQEFDAWSATPGGRRVLQIAFAITARYAARYQRTGRRVSVRLVWETLRDNVGHIRARLQAQGADLTQLNGFRLNDHLHAYVARHIMARRPEWDGLFETRELRAK